MIQTLNHSQGLYCSGTLGRRAACTLENRNSKISKRRAQAVLLQGLCLNITHARSISLCTFRVHSHLANGRDPCQGQMQKELELVACSDLQQAGVTISAFRKVTPAAVVSIGMWHLATTPAVQKSTSSNSQWEAVVIHLVEKQGDTFSGWELMPRKVCGWQLVSGMNKCKKTCRTPSYINGEKRKLIGFY